jgi:hypothetical protein
MNRSPTTVELEATGVRHFSRGDEDAFFAWLNRLPCVVRYEGHLRTLYITVNPTDSIKKVFANYLPCFVDTELAFGNLLYLIAVSLVIGSEISRPSGTTRSLAELFSASVLVKSPARTGLLKIYVCVTT